LLVVTTLKKRQATGKGWWSKNKGRRRDTNLASSKTFANLEIYVYWTNEFILPTFFTIEIPPTTHCSNGSNYVNDVRQSIPPRNEKSLPLLFVFSREITLPHLGWISNLYSQMNPSTNRIKI
jgi:hypothetical protein